MGSDQQIALPNPGKGKTMASGAVKWSVVVAGWAVVAGMSAPGAGARPTCQDSDTKNVCQTSGSVSIKARPGTTAPPANQPALPWLGMPGARR